MNTEAEKFWMCQITEMYNVKLSHLQSCPQTWLTDKKMEIEKEKKMSIKVPLEFCQNMSLLLQEFYMLRQDRFEES
jgi:hypothetical protein